MDAEETRTDLELAAATADRERRLAAESERLAEAARRYNDALARARAA